MSEVVATHYQAVVLYGPHSLEPVERAPLTQREGMVQVSVEAAGICGSDLALWLGKHPYGHYPVIPGHELGGWVLHDPAGRFAPGAVVAIRPTIPCGVCPACQAGRQNICPDVRVMGVHDDGGMAQHISVSADQIIEMPPACTPELAALVEPSAVALHMLERAGFEAGMSLAIIGAGSVGNLVLLAARKLQASSILALDRLANRLNLAATLGADHVVDVAAARAEELALASRRGGYDVTVDLVGRIETWALAARLTRAAGCVIFGALPGRPLAVDLEPFYRKELTLRTSRLYGNSFVRAASWIASGDFDPSALVTHRLPLAKALDGFKLAEEAADRSVKIHILPNEE